MSELKPCPFCGGEIKTHPTPDWSNSYYASYHTDDCWLQNSLHIDPAKDARFNLIPNDPDAIKAWNTRTTEEAKGLLEAFKKVENVELFEDGLSADLHDMGITSVALAYMTGRQDFLIEVREALAQENVDG